MLTVGGRRVEPLWMEERCLSARHVAVMALATLDSLMASLNQALKALA